MDEASEALCPLSEEQRLWGGPVVGTLGLEQTVSGRLDSDAPDPSDLWLLDTPSGQPLTILLSSAQDASVRVARVGQELGGSLALSDPGFANCTPAHIWKVEGVPAGFLRVEVVSDDFDPYLYLFTGAQRALIEDDDGAGGLNSGVSVSVAREGEEVWIVIRSVDVDGEGSYRVRAFTTEGGRTDSCPVNAAQSPPRRATGSDTPPTFPTRGGCGGPPGARRERSGQDLSGP